MNVKTVSCLALLLLLSFGAVLVYAAQIIVYSPSNIVDVTANPTPTPTPTQIDGTVSLTVNGQLSVVIDAGQSLTLQAIVNPAYPAEVTFYMDGAVLGTVTANSLGIAEYTITEITVGAHTFQAKVNTPVNVP